MHVYRNHKRPIHCSRCFAIFDTIGLLTEHIRKEPPCATQEPRAFDGIDDVQMARLRSRKQTSNTVLNEEDKWRKMYRIIFPDEDPAKAPSPCEFFVSSRNNMLTNGRLRICDSETHIQLLRNLDSMTSRHTFNKSCRER